MELGQEGIPEDWQPRYIRWARLCLLNMQIARCAWKEMSRASSAKSVRRSQNVKVSRILLLQTAAEPYMLLVYMWGNLSYQRSTIFLSK
jgi:hypothetical protein